MSERALARAWDRYSWTRIAEEWETLANEAGAVLAAVRTAGEWLKTEHARVLRAVACVDDPVLGPTWMAGLPVSLTGSPGEVRGPRHLPDADRADILAELESIRRFKRRNPARRRDVERNGWVKVLEGVVAGQQADRLPAGVRDRGRLRLAG